MPGSASDTQLYKRLLLEADSCYAALLGLYEPDIQVEQDFAACAVVATEMQRTAIAERLASPAAVSATLTGTFIQSTGRYLDSHWDDYREIPTADPEKYARRTQLHAVLENIIKEVGGLDNRLGA